MRAFKISVIASSILVASALPAAPIFEVDKLGDISYAGTSGHARQKLDLYLPGKPLDPKKKPPPEPSSPLPAVLFFHGGGWNQGAKENITWLANSAVSGGDYAAIAVNYRLSQHAKWPAQIHDCMAAVRWVRANANKHGINPDRIAVIGLSAGGHLAAMLGTAQQSPKLKGTVGPHRSVSSSIACVVTLAAPTDFIALAPADLDSLFEKNNPVIQLLGGSKNSWPTAARNASPVTHASSGDAPFLIIHGTADSVVPVSQAALLHNALESNKISSHIIEVQGAGHMGVLTPEILRETETFLKRHLQTAP